MQALIGIATAVSVVVALTVLLRFIIMRISKSQSFSLYSWITSAVIGSVWLFFIVLAQIKAAEAEKQNVIANAAQAEAQKNAEEATKNAIEAREALEEADEQRMLRVKCEGKI